MARPRRTRAGDAVAGTAEARSPPGGCAGGAAVTFAREKRMLLGWLALLAPVPLPFNAILGWPQLVAYEVVVAAFLIRAHRDPGGWLPPWAMNVLAVAYVPYFLFDLRVLSHGRLVAAVTHLMLFTVLVKLFALRRERDKWQATIAIFFLFLAAMATSVHPTIVLYLAAYLAASLLLFARFAQLHLMAGFAGPTPGQAPGSGGSRQALAGVPLRPFLAAAAVASLALAIPLFAFMPRVKDPVVTGSGRGLGTLGSATGFSDAVTLDTIGSVRESREVAMRLHYEEEPPPGHEMRFRGGAFEVYEDGSWSPRQRGGRRWVGRWGREVRLGQDAPEHWVEIYLRPVTGSAVMIPVDGLVVRHGAEDVALYTDDLEIVRRVGALGDTFEYRVGLGEGPILRGVTPLPEGFGPEEVSDAARDASQVSPRVAELTARVAGEGTAWEKAQRIETHLMSEYAYSLDFLGQGGEGGDPIEEFLFDRREGHCEYFASSMVLMLRSAGIPARLATGFLGAEHNPLEDYWVVRQSNAHAWVEAHLPERGWTMFDPTPAGGRPARVETGWTGLAAQAWDYLLFRWDRYVLTYGFRDQMSILAVAHGLWRDVLGLFDGGGDGEEPAPAPPEQEELLEVEPATPVAPEEAPWTRAAPVLALAVLLAGLGAWLAVRRARRLPSGAEAYRRLRR
ncbi:MAG: transglutaminaseTgpA domain-containing protein, partial [Thermoanaerobaculia bacterium]